MLGRKAVNRQAVVAAIHFGDSEADAVTRLHVERLAQGAEQGGPWVERDQYLFLVYCSVEKLMHQRPNPIHFFFQREMARVEKMELCAWDIPFVEFSTLHRKDSIIFAPGDQHGRLLFTEILLPIGIDIQIPLCVVED